MYTLFPLAIVYHGVGSPGKKKNKEIGAHSLRLHLAVVWYRSDWYQTAIPLTKISIPIKIPHITLHKFIMCKYDLCPIMLLQLPIIELIRNLIGCTEISNTSIVKD